jgi:hypothetical protein
MKRKTEQNLDINILEDKLINNRIQRYLKILRINRYNMPKRKIHIKMGTKG